MMGAVTPETGRVILQEINICILLHLVGLLLILNYVARNHELKMQSLCIQTNLLRKIVISLNFIEIITLLISEYIFLL